MKINKGIKMLTRFIILLLLFCCSCAKQTCLVPEIDDSSLCLANDFNRSKLAYEKKLLEMPNNESLLRSYLFCGINSNNISELRPYATKLFALKQKSPCTLKALGIYYYKSKEYLSAYVNFQKLVLMDEAYIKAVDYYYLARSMENIDLHPINEWKKSHELYQREYSSNKKDAYFLTDFGYVSQRVGNLEQAISLYQEALRLDPNYKRALSLLSKLKAKK